MKSILKSMTAFVLALLILFAVACSPNTGKNVGDGCGTWSKNKDADTTQINPNGI